jgi:ribosomal-protein-alanine N-acetyltransferase
LQEQDTINYIVFLGLGTNLGNLEANLTQTISEISSHPQISLLKKSKWYKNSAIEEAGPNNFLNGVIKISTSFKPLELLAFINSIEATIDPDRNARGRKKARLIDVDILTYGDLHINTSELTIPHPRMKQRDFVMKPLREIEASDYASEILEKIEAPEKTRQALINKSKKLARELINKNRTCVIRRMYLADLDQVFSLDERIFGAKHWTREAFIKELSNPNAVYYVAETDSKVVAFIGAWLVVDEMHIMTFATDPDHRRKGIGETLLIAALDTALENGINKIILEVRLSNTAAQDLYLKYGFHKNGVRRGYYEPDQEDALLLQLEQVRGAEFLHLFCKTLELLSLRGARA